MKIERVTLYNVSLPMTHPYTLSYGTIIERPTVIVKVETSDGLVGYGEAASMGLPYYNHETVDTCMVILKKHVVPLVLNKEFGLIEDVVEFLRIIKRNNIAKAGLEMALWMTRSIREQKSLKELLGGNREKIAVGKSIGIHKTVEDTLMDVQDNLDKSYELIKLKIKPGWEVEVVKAVREKFGDIALMVDANSSYTLDHIKIFEELDKYNLVMIEQPLADDDIVDHAILQRKIKTPICLDESICSVDDARKAIAIGACKIINIKPVRVGGLVESKRIHDLCKKKGVGVWCGGMFESTIGRAYCIALASLSNFIYPADISYIFDYYSDDLTKSSFKIEDGFIAVADEVGLGYEVDEKKIEMYAVEKVVIE